MLVMAYTFLGANVESAAFGSYPHPAPCITEDRKYWIWTEWYLVRYNLTAWSQITYGLILAVSYLHDTIRITGPMVSFWSIAECTYFCFAILQFVKALRMVLEGYLGKIEAACYPEDSLIGKEMLSDRRHTVVA